MIVEGLILKKNLVAKTNARVRDRSEKPAEKWNEMEFCEDL